jgi:3-oxoacyl-[acyl-carrier-protein] synthase II
MALAAAREAITRSEIADPANTGLILGTGAGGIDFTLDQARAAFGQTPPTDLEPGKGGGVSLWTITNATHGNLAGELSINLGLHGPSLCVSDGCASASDAVGLAMELLRSDRPGAPTAMLAVGADAHVRWETLLGMELLGVISTAEYDEPARASRPFDAKRDGFVLGEGAWAVLLEREDAARTRGAAVLGTLDGYGSTCDAYHRVRPDPDMRECRRAIACALEDAGVGPGEIDLVHYHGTATPMNDRVEVHAVREAFGEHAARLRGHSVKSMIGHPQGASGLASLVATLAGLCSADGDEAGPFVHPTTNVDDLDPDCALEVTANIASPARGDERFVINCLAFGAKNSVLVGRAGPSR